MCEWERKEGNQGNKIKKSKNPKVSSKVSVLEVVVVMVVGPDGGSGNGSKKRKEVDDDDDGDDSGEMRWTRSSIELSSNSSNEEKRNRFFAKMRRDFTGYRSTSDETVWMSSYYCVWWWWCLEVVTQNIMCYGKCLRKKENGRGKGGCVEITYIQRENRCVFVWDGIVWCQVFVSTLK